MKLFPILIALLLTFGIYSCVPARKFNEAQDTISNYKKKVDDAKFDIKKCKDENIEVNDRYTDLNRNYADLQEDHRILTDRYDRVTKLNEDLNVLYEKLIEQNKQLTNNASNDRKELSEAVSVAQAELDKKQLQLTSLESELKSREANMAQLKRELEEREARMNNLQGDKSSLEKDLAAREKRVQELESAIRARDKKNKEIRSKIDQALLGFKETDLKVEEKDGKVYVSLSQELLFKSGSKTLDSKGKSAISKLAEVLKKNTDIAITVEGHTDADGDDLLNWNLSTGRAVTVVDALTAGGVDPKRVIASGRGEYFPVSSNSSESGKAMNRRTEIILSPDLSKLYDIINN